MNRIKPLLRTLSVLSVVLIGLSGCGDESAVSSRDSSLSGRYVAEIPGAGMGFEFDFSSDGTAIFTMEEGGSRDDMECTYESGESRIAVSCFGSSGMSLTRLEGGDLEGDMDGMIVRYRKR